VYQHRIPVTGHNAPLQRWFDWMSGAHSEDGILQQLADDVVFYSPVVHTPQRGKMITAAYLMAAGESLGGDTFRYTRVMDLGHEAVLEFECELDGISVNGIDMFTWNEAGLISEFKVMVRPLKGMQAVHSAMGRALARMKTGA
jgi:hypothetical protein